jgi:membrane protein implicated in regulation of membrane protease activity
MSPDLWLRGIYWFTTVFGVGVTLVDMLGLLGHHAGHAHDGGDHGGSHHGGHAGESHDGTHGHPGSHDSAAHDHGSGETLLSVLFYLRMAVYFSFGFGPIGLIAAGMGRGSLESVLWAVPGGIAAAILARAIFRFQQEDVDSSIRDDDLLFETATVTVSITGGNMGKVRLRVGQIVAERYALAADRNDTFRPDDRVQIVEVTEGCVYVRRLDELNPPEGPSETSRQTR